MNKHSAHRKSVSLAGLHCVDTSIPVLATALALFAFASCAKREDAPPPKPPQPMADEGPAPQPHPGPGHKMPPFDIDLMREIGLAGGEIRRKSLRFVSLADTAVTDAAVEQLKAALPDCRIER